MMRASKPLRFLMAMALLLGADAAVPRREGWPAPLLQRERLLALLHLQPDVPPQPVPGPAVASVDRGEQVTAEEVEAELAEAEADPAELAPAPAPTEALREPTQAELEASMSLAPPSAAVCQGPPGTGVAAATANVKPASCTRSLAAATRPAIANLPPPEPGEYDAKEPFVEPDDPAWEALQSRLAQLASGGDVVVRVLHVGDSEIAGDGVSRTLRRQFVKRYGDAGPGFSLALAPWHWYWRESFQISPPESFSTVSLAMTKKGDGNYGPGGVAFNARSAQASAELELSAKGRGSCNVALLYGVQPGGAELELLADGKSVERVSTAGDVQGVGRKDLQLSPCPKKLGVRALGVPARIFGWSVEWGKPGVVWSALGVVGASSIHFHRYGAGQIGEALAQLQPDLLVVAHGLNVAQIPQRPSEAERRGLRRLVQEFRQAAPNAACLVMSPYPVAYVDGGQVAPSPSTAMLARMQRQVAQEQGCAWLDRVALEGGPETAMQWLNSKPRILSGDYVHLTHSGSEKVGVDVAQVLLTRLGEQDG
jgi:lysophospholipase L1-like esterase